jgi:hypothetical protein
VSQPPFTILDRLADSDRPYHSSPMELRILCHELEMHEAYDILAWRREADKGGQIEITITYKDKS